MEHYENMARLAELKELRLSDTKSDPLFYLRTHPYTSASSYIWLGPGWHCRANEELIAIEEPFISELVLEKKADIIKNFISSYITSSSFYTTFSNGCVVGVQNAIRYTKSLKPNGKLCIPTPTYNRLHESISDSDKILCPFECEDDILRFVEQNHGPMYAILLCNPNNPTGVAYSKRFLERLGELATKFDFYIIEDAAYMLFSGKQCFAFNYTQNCITLIGATKLFLNTIRCGLTLTHRPVSYFTQTEYSDKHICAKYLLLLERVQLRPEILDSHIIHSQKISQMVQKLFLKYGFVVHTTQPSPIFLISYKNYVGEVLFSQLAKVGIITMATKDSFVRINTRAIYQDQLTDFENRLKLCTQIL